MHPLLQFTLDFFESKRPLAPVEPAQPAIKPIANRTPPPADRIETSASGSTFRHPCANREALLDGQVVAFEFKRGKRRTIGFVVGPEGLRVRAPTWVTLRAVDAALQEKAGWIIKKLGETTQRQALVAARCIEWRDGTTIPFLGEPVTVVLSPGPGWRVKGAVLTPVENDPHSTQTGAPRHRLQLGLPPSATPDQIRDAVQVWLMQQARQLFAERLNHFAPLLQVQWRKLSLSNAQTRWGSARIDGAIRLNWRLLHFRLPVIDYVVAHELSHLREMNHSSRFWDTVRTVVPDYAALRAQLKSETAPRWA
ncbi:MAG: SprT family zinc-dependent metalloprotease [Pseudomonadota bacterium]